MNNDIQTILEKVLTVIAYDDDKNVFINGFLQLCLQKTLTEYADLLPEQRKEILRRILQGTDPVKVREQLEPYISTEEFTKLYHENTQKLMQNYFETIMPTLTKEQKSALNIYFSTITEHK